MENHKFGLWKFRPQSLQRLANVQSFAFFLSIFGFVVGILPMYSVSQITSLEKHFGLSSQQAGTIVASSEIGFLATSLITGHFFSPLHRPRIIGTCALLTSLSCFIFTVPFMMHLSKDQNIAQDLVVNTEVSLCAVKPQCPTLETDPDSFAYYLFIICTILSGIGSTSFYTLGIAYVDDNASKRMAPKYIGYILSLRFASPAFGLLLGSMTSTVPVHFKNESKSELEFVGAWWIGYFVIGALGLVSGLPLMMFPKSFRVTRTFCPPVEMNNKGHKVGILGNDEETSVEAIHQDKTEETDRLRRINDSDSEDARTVLRDSQRRKSSVVIAKGWTKTKELLKDFPKALLRLLTNPAFDCLALAMTLDICGMVGVVSFAPKYVESQFDRSASEANFIIGLAIPTAASFGILVSGKIMSQSEKKLRQKILAAIITMVLAYGSFPLLLAFKCPHVVGTFDPVERGCNSHCSCSESDFTTICGSDGLTYYSPCHAGCTDFNEEIFTQCSCILGNRTASPGHCKQPCNLGQIIGYATVQFTINFVSTVATMPMIILSLRIVRPGDKSLSLAVINVIASLFILPTPILFGTLVDGACVFPFPVDACSASGGACAYYDNDRFRFVLHLLGTALKLGCPLMLLASWFASGKMNLDQRDTDEGERRASEIDVNKLNR